MQEFELKVTDKDIEVLSLGLTELPYKISATLITKLQQQINEQLKQDREVENVS